MKKLFSFAPLTLLCFGLWLWSLACSSTGQSPSEAHSQYTIATDNYAVLAEKAITYQADFEWEAWGSMLADDVHYLPFDSASPLVGKKAVLAYWEANRIRSHIHTVRLSEFTHIPLRTNRSLYSAGPPGVYVYTICRSEIQLQVGQKQTRHWVIHTHFNEQNLIDHLYTYANQVL